LQGLAATAIPVLKRSLNNLLRSALVVGRTELDKRAQAAVSDAYRHALLSTASQHVHAGDGELLAELLDLESGLIGEVAIGEGFDAKSFAALLSENIWLQVLREFTPQTLVYDDYSTFMRRRAHAAQTLMESLCENLTRNVRPRLAAQLCAESGSPHTRHPAVMVAELARERVRALNFSQEKIVAATSLSAAMVRKLLARSTRPRTQYGSGRIASLAPVQTFSAYLGMDWAVNYLCAITVELAPEHAKRLASGRLHASRYKNVRLCCEHLQTMGAPATALSRIRDIAAGDELPNTGDSSWQEPFRELVFWERVRLGL
jgi:hypothetical protein